MIEERIEKDGDKKNRKNRDRAEKKTGLCIKRKYRRRISC